MRPDRIFTIITFISLISFSVYAQADKELSFSETIYDFGNVNEVDGPIEHEFTFTNNGEDPLKIVNVRASCGCTTPGWSKEEVPAGGTGFVKARYNPTNRPGAFNKSLTVTTTGSTSTYVLFIKGSVNPKPRTIEDDLPTLLGGIRVKSRAFSLGRALNNKAAVMNYPVYNASEGPITFLDSMVAPEYINIDINPMTLQPKEQGTITVTYDVVSRNDLGMMTDNVSLFTDEETEPRKNFSVYASVEEYFPPMTAEELEQAPKLTFEKPIYDFGNIKQGEVVSNDFVFKNTGKTALNIRKTATTCGCTVAKLTKADLLPGEEATITITFDSKGRRGQQQKSITVFSNDPKAPTQRIMIKANISI